MNKDEKIDDLKIEVEISQIEAPIKEDDIIPPVKDNLFALSEDQIEQKGIEHLPETLHSAVKAFKKSILMQEVMGDHLFHEYIDAKEKEWKEYHTTVSEFELAKYLNR